MKDGWKAHEASVLHQRQSPTPALTHVESSHGCPESLNVGLGALSWQPFRISFTRLEGLARLVIPVLPSLSNKNSAIDQDAERACELTAADQRTTSGCKSSSSKSRSSMIPILQSLLALRALQAWRAELYETTSRDRTARHCSKSRKAQAQLHEPPRPSPRPLQDRITVLKDTRSARLQRQSFANIRAAACQRSLNAPMATFPATTSGDPCGLR